MTVKHRWSYIPARTESGNDHSSIFTIRTGTVRFADGTEHKALLEFCETDANEHYRTGILVGDPDGFDFDNDIVWQENLDEFLARLGRNRDEVFPYAYRYDGPLCENDHHVDADGWCR